MKTISIVIPVYNEEDRLEKTFKVLKAFVVPHGLKLEKIIFVDDGSTDGTKIRIEKFIEESVKIHLISYKQNRGKGHAISAGMKMSISDYTLFLDADMSTDIGEVRKFLPAMRNNVPIIIGTRKNGHSTVVRHQPFIRETLGKGFTLLSNIILNTWVTDFTCGFKAFKREAKNIIFPKLKI